MSIKGDAMADNNFYLELLKDSNLTNISNEDKEITLRIKESGIILGIKLLDHIIIGNDVYYSFKEHDEV